MGDPDVTSIPLVTFANSSKSKKHRIFLGSVIPADKKSADLIFKPSNMLNNVKQAAQWWTKQSKGLISSWNVVQPSKIQNFKTSVDCARTPSNMHEISAKLINKIQKSVNSKAFTGSKKSGYVDHLVYFVPPQCNATNEGYSVGGLGSIPSGNNMHACDQYINTNSCSVILTQMFLSTTTHELGHNLTLNHAHLCLNFNYYLAKCIEGDEYGNYFSVMGSNGPNLLDSLDAYEKDYFGIDKAKSKTISYKNSQKTFTQNVNFINSSTGINYLKIKDVDFPEHYYYVEVWNLENHKKYLDYVKSPQIVNILQNEGGGSGHSLIPSSAKKGCSDQASFNTRCNVQAYVWSQNMLFVSQNSKVKISIDELNSSGAKITVSYGDFSSSQVSICPKGTYFSQGVSAGPICIKDKPCGKNTKLINHICVAGLQNIKIGFWDKTKGKFVQKVPKYYSAENDFYLLPFPLEFKESVLSKCQVENNAAEIELGSCGDNYLHLLVKRVGKIKISITLQNAIGQKKVLSASLVTKLPKSSAILWVFSKIKNPISDFNNLSAKRRQAIKFLYLYSIASSNHFPIAFHPKNVVSKGQLAQFIWKIIGSPDSSNKTVRQPNVNSKFKSYFAKDKGMKKLSEGDSNAKARYNTILYLASKKLFGTTKFSPQTNANRATIALWFYKIAGSPKFELTEAIKNTFDDIKGDTETNRAVWYLKSKNVIAGVKVKGKNMFYPKKSVTRSAMAEILLNYYQNALLK